MNKQSLLQKAKEGDVDAIAILLNYALEHKQITTKVKLYHNCLQITLTSERIPYHYASLTLIDRELIKWQSPLFKIVELVGYQEGEKFPSWSEKFEVGSRATSYLASRKQTKKNQIKHQKQDQNIAQISYSISNLPTQDIDNESWKSIGIGFFLSILLLISNKLSFIFSYFITLVHELGHATVGWIFGYPSIPAFDFLFGGGITIQQERWNSILILIYLLIGFLFYLVRKNSFAISFLIITTIIYSISAFSSIHNIIFIYMGHGFELIFAGIFLYRAISGYACRYSIERPLYASIGFFTLFYDIRFAWRLIFSPFHRSIYKEGKGGILDHDFVRLAGEYFHVNLSVISIFFLLCCVLTPVVTFLAYRYRNLWVYFVLRLWRNKEELIKQS